METQGDTLVITRSWRNLSAWVLLFFALFWNGFLIVWHGIALSTGAWSMSVFGLIHTGVGLFLIYYVAALFLNSTVIRASPRSLESKSGPLPWKGDRQLDAGTVSQLYCKEEIHRSKNRSSASYQVDAVLPGNRRETLVWGLPEADHALFIEQQLERHLRLADVPVAGEHGR